jgi:hypothetical protein
MTVKKISTLSIQIALAIILVKWRRVYMKKKECIPVIYYKSRIRTSVIL